VEYDFCFVHEYHYYGKSLFPSTLSVEVDPTVMILRNKSMLRPQTSVNGNSHCGLREFKSGNSKIYCLNDFVKIDHKGKGKVVLCFL
jgi:hypothetical protein